MLTCKEVSSLVSQSLDRDLPLRQRMALRLHLMMCSLCRTYTRQMHVLRRIVRQSADIDISGEEHLPEDARGRIRHALKERQDTDRTA